MHFRYGIVVFFVCFSCWSIHGQGGHDRVYTFQDHHSIFGKNNVSLSLAPLFAGGYEINYDRRIIERHWLKLAPMYFRKQNYRDTELSSMREVRGYGFKFQHKYFPYANTEQGLGFFLSYGPTFQYFLLENHNRENLSFNKMGLDCVIGVRKVFREIFYFEFYAGLAMNYLQIRTNETQNWRESLESFDRFWFDYGKTGNFMTLGLNVGVLF
jgi:hypothetical protein